MRNRGIRQLIYQAAASISSAARWLGFARRAQHSNDTTTVAQVGEGLGLGSGNKEIVKEWWPEHNEVNRQDFEEWEDNMRDLRNGKESGGLV